MRADETTRITTDVLVGGGLAGAWAALRAAEHGASVLLVDKGYVSRAGCSPMSGGVKTGPTPQDDLDLWIDEFIRCGNYMNNQDWLEALLADQVERVDIALQQSSAVRADDRRHRRHRPLHPAGPADDPGFRHRDHRGQSRALRGSGLLRPGGR